MLVYTIKRFFEMVIVFFLFLVISYLLFNAIPGNAFSSLLLNPLLPPEAYQKTIEAFGLDKPLFERVQLYIINFFKGDFGYSYTYYPRTPIDLIAERLPRTLMLFSIVNVVAFYTGFLVGKILAWRSASDEIFYTLILFTTISSFLLFLVFIFTRNIESLQKRRNARLFGLIILASLATMYWTNGEAALKRFYAADIAYHMILPTFTVTLVAFAGTALLTRTTMMEVLKDDYILTARAKGLSQKRIRDRHAARTALLPVVTSFIFTIITIIDGSVLTESIFSWPGMGQLILEAVVQEDIPLAMATFSFIGILALIAHFIADISYAFLDPRIRIKAEN